MEKDTQITQTNDAKAVAYIANHLPNGGQGATINIINAIHISHDTDNQSGNRTHTGDKLGNVNYSSTSTDDIPPSLFGALTQLLEDMPDKYRFDTLMRMALEISMAKHRGPTKQAEWLGISKNRIEKFRSTLLQLGDKSDDEV